MKQVRISVITPSRNAIALAGMIDALVFTHHTIEASN